VPGQVPACDPSAGGGGTDQPEESDWRMPAQLQVPVLRLLAHRARMTTTKEKKMKVIQIAIERTEKGFDSGLPETYVWALSDDGRIFVRIAGEWQEQEGPFQ
jgi:hypothetical protein